MTHEERTSTWWSRWVACAEFFQPYSEAARKALAEEFAIVAKERDERISALESENVRLRELVDSSEWGEDVRDEWSEAIDAAFPTRSGSHATFDKAMKMVGHRYSKASLVSLVNWLLVDAEQDKRKE